jgi:branched-chain amino acid transport system ATP-binding protein
MSALAVVDLHAGYGKIDVCRSISLSIEDGECLALLGPNGAGKSTLLGALAGVVEGKGEITLSGRRLDGLRARARARAGLALVPEGRRNLFAPMTVRDNLLLGLRLLPSAERDQTYLWLLSLFPILAKREQQGAGLLSGGEQQMLALAVALSRKPKLVLLDEPSQGLAPVILDQLVENIRALRSMGLTVLLAEQNQRFAAALADRSIVLCDGELIEGGMAALADSVLANVLPP